jgi:hypothetical protein
VTPLILGVSVSHTTYVKKQRDGANYLNDVFGFKQACGITTELIEMTCFKEIKGPSSSLI